MIFGASPKLPGQILSPGEASSFEPGDSFACLINQKLKSVPPFPSKHHSTPASFIPSDLLQAKSVFIRHDAVRRPLQRLYDGPFPVISAGPKFFTVQKNGSPYTVSVDRLKPAVLPASSSSSSSSSSATSPVTAFSPTSGSYDDDFPPLPGCLLYTSPSPRD